MPETYGLIILQKKVNRLRKEDPVQNAQLYCQHEKQDWSFKGVVSRTIFRPFKMLALEPILILITIYTAIVYGLLYGCGSFFISPYYLPSNPPPYSAPSFPYHIRDKAGLHQF